MNRDVDVRPFPVHELGEPPGFIPWWLAEIAYKAYIKEFGNNSQSLERLYERGGFGRRELMYLLTGKWMEIGDRNGNNV
jgi:hypothetical protein